MGGGGGGLFYYSLHVLFFFFLFIFYIFLSSFFPSTCIRHIYKTYLTTQAAVNSEVYVAGLTACQCDEAALSSSLLNCPDEPHKLGYHR